MRRGKEIHTDRDERRGITLLRAGWIAGVYACCGLVVTIVVAWALAWMSVPESDNRGLSSVDETGDPARMFEYFGSFGASGVYCVQFIDAEDRARWLDDNALTITTPWYAEHLSVFRGPGEKSGPFLVWAAGWPVRCLAFEIHHAPLGGKLSLPTLPADTEIRGGLKVPGAAREGRSMPSPTDLYLPLLPLWRGLIANALFYAVPVWLARPGFVRLRGRIRLRRGRCGWRGGCGYDLSGSDGDVCPECGRPVVSSPSRRAIGRGAASA